jgi:hypothetical protein
MTDPTFNLAQLATRPNRYDHLGQVEAAMADERRTSAAWASAFYHYDALDAAPVTP